MLAHNAATHVQKVMTSKNTCSPIQERSYLFAHGVTSPAQELFTSDSQPDTFRRNVFQLHAMQLRLHYSWEPQETQANPFASKTFWLLTV